MIKRLRDVFLNQELASGSDFKNIKHDKGWDGWVFHCSSFNKLRVIINYFTRYELKTKKSLAFKNDVKYMIWF